MKKVCFLKTLMFSLLAMNFVGLLATKPSAVVSDIPLEKQTNDELTNAVVDQGKTIENANKPSGFKSFASNPLFKIRSWTVRCWHAGVTIVSAVALIALGFMYRKRSKGTAAPTSPTAVPPTAVPPAFPVDPTTEPSNPLVAKGSTLSDFKRFVQIELSESRKFGSYERDIVKSIVSLSKITKSEWAEFNRLHNDICFFLESITDRKTCLSIDEDDCRRLLELSSEFYSIPNEYYKAAALVQHPKAHSDAVSGDVLLPEPAKIVEPVSRTIAAEPTDSACTKAYKALSIENKNAGSPPVDRAKASTQVEVGLGFRVVLGVKYYLHNKDMLPEYNAFAKKLMGFFGLRDEDPASSVNSVPPPPRRPETFPVPSPAMLAALPPPCAPIDRPVPSPAHSAPAASDSSVLHTPPPPRSPVALPMPRRSPEAFPTHFHTADKKTHLGKLPVATEWMKLCFDTNRGPDSISKANIVTLSKTMYTDDTKVEIHSRAGRIVNFLEEKLVGLSLIENYEYISRLKEELHQNVLANDQNCCEAALKQCIEIAQKLKAFLELRDEAHASPTPIPTPPPPSPIYHQTLFPTPEDPCFPMAPTPTPPPPRGVPRVQTTPPPTSRPTRDQDHICDFDVRRHDNTSTPGDHEPVSPEDHVAPSATVFPPPPFRAPMRRDGTEEPLSAPGVPAGLCSGK